MSSASATSNLPPANHFRPTSSSALTSPGRPSALSAMMKGEASVSRVPETSWDVASGNSAAEPSLSPWLGNTPVTVTHTVPKYITVTMTPTQSDTPSIATALPSEALKVVETIPSGALSSVHGVLRAVEVERDSRSTHQDGRGPSNRSKTALVTSALHSYLADHDPRPESDEPSHIGSPASSWAAGSTAGASIAASSVVRPLIARAWKVTPTRTMPPSLPSATTASELSPRPLNDLGVADDDDKTQVIQRYKSDSGHTLKSAWSWFTKGSSSAPKEPAAKAVDNVESAAPALSTGSWWSVITGEFVEVGDSRRGLRNGLRPRRRTTATSATAVTPVPTVVADTAPSQVLEKDTKGMFQTFGDMGRGTASMVQKTGETALHLANPMTYIRGAASLAGSGVDLAVGAGQSAVQPVADTASDYWAKGSSLLTNYWSKGKDLVTDFSRQEFDVSPITARARDLSSVAGLSSYWDRGVGFSNIAKEEALSKASLFGKSFAQGLGSAAQWIEAKAAVLDHSSAMTDRLAATPTATLPATTSTSLSKLMGSLPTVR
ncbi:hypothetical protein BD324DRAFT_683759 [Kockovaella imperatae]|uniref:Uncharacterized protein n=1 Tax=Kockovaella imperatae TaxID=4999 RepID=A0A1Y1U7C3_9TREE|nr:hypothetical protein BD324DRAFT_683759 [Kockovaella imperatae]ORX33908.1 hypothetical protein BD324DRAFT_683759 [Kockovaella imperatae]